MNHQDTTVFDEIIEQVKHGDFIGNCKWFNKKIGYGFITVYTGEYKGRNIFVHHTGINPLNSHFKTLRKGEYVNLNVIVGKNGLQAVDVTGVCGGPLMCDNLDNRSNTYPLEGGPLYCNNAGEHTSQ
jgi:cold shock CspA family protein